LSLPSRGPFPLLTVNVEVGRVPRVENDRREDQQSTTPPSEASHYEAPRREWESSSAADAPHDAPREDRGDEGPREDQQSYESAPPQEGGGQPPQHGQGAPMGPGGPRGRRRGGRGRMSSRDRRMRGGRGRDRDRGPAPAYNRPGDRPPSSGGTHPQGEREEARYSDVPPEERSLIQQAKAEVERIRETLDGVLRDLEDVCEQLTKAEHEKDIAEAEIEQLRESLRRLQR
jgi:hypothetical protein